LSAPALPGQQWFEAGKAQFPKPEYYNYQKRIERAERLRADFGLKEVAHRRFAEYSKGMKRKLTINRRWII